MIWPGWNEWGRVWRSCLLKLMALLMNEDGLVEEDGGDGDGEMGDTEMAMVSLD